VWSVEFDHPAEAGEPSKRRPAVIVSSDRFNATKAWTVVAVPLTTMPRGNPLHVELEVEGLDEASYAQSELVGVVSRRRLVHRIGRVDPPALEALDERLRMMLDL
jgi:mRNA interferase MazF